MMNDNTQRSSMNPTQNNNITYEDKSTIRRNLTVSERQAYEGARLFYYSVFPTSIIFIMVLHVHLYEESRVDHSQLKEYPIGYIISLIVFACLSFLLAARQYYLCNKIETSPLFVLGSEFSLVEENTIRSEPGDNTPLQPSLKPPKHFCK